MNKDKQEQNLSSSVLAVPTSDSVNTPLGFNLDTTDSTSSGVVTVRYKVCGRATCGKKC